MIDKPLRSGRTAALLIAAVAALACGESTAPREDDEEEEPLELGLELVVDGLTHGVFLTSYGNDPRLFVVERLGRVRIIKGGTLLDTPFLDISSRVGTVYSRGLLGLAFDPQYATNGKFFVYYIDRFDHVVVERFSSTPGSDVAGASDGVVIRFPHGGEDLHGGTLTFGPDNMLYFASGDGGCCDDPENDSQNLSNLLGKMVRIDVSTFPYSVPSSNPFVGQANVRPEIWALGLRNPWRFTFDGGLLYIADVGERELEEVNVVSAAAAGLNYGWRRMEGRSCFNPAENCAQGLTLTMPVHQYPRAEGCAIIGGYVYRGRAIPELVGHYLYSDYCEGWLRSFRSTGTFTGEHRQWPEFSLPGIVSFGRDAAWELYVMDEERVWKVVRR